MQFPDSIEGALSMVRDIVSDAPPSSRAKIRRTADKVRKACLDLQKDNPKDADVALGITWAVLAAAQHMTQSGGGDATFAGEDGPRIQLLS